MYMLAMKPQKSSGYLAMKSGPGEGKQRDERARGSGIIGRFGTRDSFDHAGAEFFRMTRQAFFHRIGDERCDHRTRTG